MLEAVLFSFAIVFALFVMHWLVHKSFQMRLDFMRGELKRSVLDAVDEKLEDYKKHFCSAVAEGLNEQFVFFSKDTLAENKVVAEGEFEKKEGVVIHHACPKQPKTFEDGYCSGFSGSCSNAEVLKEKSCTPVNDICLGSPDKCQRPIKEVCEEVNGEPCKDDYSCKDFTCENLKAILNLGKGDKNV